MMMKIYPAILLLFVVAACGSGVSPADGVDVVTKPDWGQVHASPGDEEFLQAHQALLAASANMTSQELMDLWYQEPEFGSGPEFDVWAADFAADIAAAWELTDEEKAGIAAQGFGVLDRVRYASHALGYEDVWVRDLPVLITTDSILFALHRSFDRMLKQVEEDVLIVTLRTILEDLRAELSSDGVAADPLLQSAREDLDLYYSVALSLLNGTSTETVFPGTAGKLDDILAGVGKLQPRLIELFGRPYPCSGPGCAYDFSQFKPRGHYTETPELEQYFRAMIWLGRTDIMLTRFHRELVVTAELNRHLAAGNTFENWKAVEQVVAVFVGASDNLTPEGWQAFVEQEGAPSEEDLLNPETAAELMKTLEGGGFGAQTIMSQIMMTDPMNSEPTALPPSFKLLGQRYVIDSHVFHNVTFDRVAWQGEKVQRMLPDPLDGLFVLGHQEALPLLLPQLDEYHYAQNLHVMRSLVEAHTPEFWGMSMYNGWLQSIRSLGMPTTGDGYPAAMKTHAYHLKTMNTALASWAELRHDTILYVKQSYSGVACDYPDGYVEPHPEFYKKIGTFADRAKEQLSGLPFSVDSKANHFLRFSEAAAILESIALKELAGEPRSPDETAFIKSLVVEDGMCGAPPVAGWYTKLFYDASDMDFVFDPTVADVHTDPNAGEILHVGTGYSNLMVMVVDTTCGQRAYAGPVSSYYEQIEGGMVRLTDEDWVKQFELAPPNRPEWTGEFVL
jgi:hypothetical protein